MAPADEFKAIVVDHMRSSRILACRIYEISKEAGAKRPLPVGFKLYAALVPLADRYPKVQDALFQKLLGELEIPGSVQASLEQLGERKLRHAVLLWSKNQDRLRKALEAVRVFLDGLGFSTPDQAEYATTVNNAVFGLHWRDLSVGTGGVSRSYSVHDAGRAWDDRLSEVLMTWLQITRHAKLADHERVSPQQLQEATDRAIAAQAEGRIDRPSRDYLQTVLQSIRRLEASARDQLLRYLADPSIATQTASIALIRDSLQEGPWSSENLKLAWGVAGSMGDSWADGTMVRGLTRMIQAGLLVHAMLEDAQTTLECGVTLPLIPRRPHLTVVPSSGPTGP